VKGQRVTVRTSSPSMALLTNVAAARGCAPAVTSWVSKPGIFAREGET
jgi:hypothetical protein